MKNKTLNKILAIVLAIVTVLSCFMFIPQAQAAKYSRQSWYGHHRYKVNGQDAFCIDFGKESGNKWTAKSVTAWNYWNGLNSDQRDNIELAVTAAHILWGTGENNEKLNLSNTSKFCFVA